jgi:hypothetical protein
VRPAGLLGWPAEELVQARSWVSLARGTKGVPMWGGSSPKTQGEVAVGEAPWAHCWRSSSAYRRDCLWEDHQQWKFGATSI